MIESIFRPNYQKYFVNPVACWLVKYTTIKPTGITYVSIVFGLMCLIFLIIRQPGLAVAALLISGYLDSLDGTLARQKQLCSPVGAAIDIVADRLVEFLVIIGLFLISPETRGLAALLMLGSSLVCVTSFLVIAIFIQNQGYKSFHYSVGLMERAEAFVFFIAMMLIPTWFIFLALAYTVLVFYTAFKRVYEFSKQAGRLNDAQVGG